MAKRHPHVKGKGKKLQNKEKYTKKRKADSGSDDNISESDTETFANNVTKDSNEKDNYMGSDEEEGDDDINEGEGEDFDSFTSRVAKEMEDSMGPEQKGKNKLYMEKFPALNKAQAKKIRRTEEKREEEVFICFLCVRACVSGVCVCE